MLGYFCVSILTAYGIAIALVEKGDDFPIRFFKVNLKKSLGKIDRRLRKLLDCTACTSFWAAGICDFILFIASGGRYWFWPLSGFAALGFTWLLTSVLNALEKSHIIYQIKDE